MKKAKSTEKLIKDIYTNKLRVTASSNLDERILANSISTLDKVNSKKSVSPRLGIWSTIARSRITQIAAAAVIIIATSLFFMQPEQPQEIKTQQITETAKSPAELTTFASLTFAYRQGGMEMVEQMCDKAIAMAGPQLSGISAQDLLSELNGKIQKGQSYEK